MHILLQLLEPDVWESFLNMAGHVSHIPLGSVDSEGQPIPTYDQWSEEYTRHGFGGRANSILARTRFGEISGKRLDLVLSRSERRIWLRVENDVDFASDLVEPVLETLAFPGEDRYEEARRLGPFKTDAPSPYVVSLRHFPKFGRKVRKGRARYDVQYEGPTILAQQLQAVERLVGDEEDLCDRAKLAIFRYYTEDIYPLLSVEIGRQDKLWPSCQTAEDVMRLVKLASLMVHEPREDGTVPIGLRFECSWDVEHTLGLRAMNSTIEAVGDDFVALDRECTGWPGFRSSSGESANQTGGGS